MAATTDPHWLTQALCRQYSPDMWFADNGPHKALALHLCRSHCPVLDKCAAADLGQRTHGIYSGVSYRANGVKETCGQRQSSVNCPTCIDSRDQFKPTSAWGDCGRPAAYRRHVARGERPCRRCTSGRDSRSQHRCTPPPATPVRTSPNTAGTGRKATADRHARQVQQLRDLSAAGYADRQIADKLGWTHQKVWRWRRAHNIPPANPAPDVTVVPVDEATVDKIRQMAADGHIDRLIAAEVGLSVRKVTRLRHVNGIPAATKRGGWRHGKRNPRLVAA